MTTAAEVLRTGWEDDTASSDTLALAGYRAMVEKARVWAEAAGGRVARQGAADLADAASPVVYLNLAATAATIDVASAAEIARFFPAGRPFVLVSPHPTPDLRAAGLELVGHPPFMVRPAGGVVPDPPPGVDVIEVVDAAGLRVWGEVLAAAFPSPATAVPASLLGGAMRFWLARVDGVPVATAASYAAHGVVVVDAVATLPEHRDRGVGAAVTWAATVADPDAPAVLIASDDGVGVYRAMGYLALSRWTMWMRPG